MSHGFPESGRLWASPVLSTSLVVAVGCLLIGVGFAMGRGLLLVAVASVGLFVVVVWLRWGGFGLFTLSVASLAVPLQVLPLTAPVVAVTGSLSLAEIAIVTWAVCVGVWAAASLRTSSRGALDARRRYAVAACAVLGGALALGWALTLYVAPASRTGNGVRGALLCVSVLLLSVRLVDTSRKARILIVAAMAPLTLVLGGMFVEQYIANLPYFYAVSPANARFWAGYAFPHVREELYWATRAGAPAAAVMLVGVAWFLGSGRTSLRVTGALMALAGFTVLLSTQTRAAWLGATFALLSLGLLGARGGLWPGGRAFAVFAVSGAVALCAVGITLLSASLGARVVSLGAFSSDSSTFFHVKWWTIGLDLWSTHPFTGAGYGSVQALFGFYEHSTYVATLNGLGPLGFLALGVAAFGIARAGWRLTGLSREATVLGLQCLGVLIVMCFAGIAEDSTFTTPQVWAIWGAAVGVSVCRVARRRS